MIKSNYIQYIATLAFIILLGQFGLAQKKEYTQPSEENRFSVLVNGGIGGFFGGDGGFTGSAAVQYQFKKTFLQVQVAGITELGLFETDYNNAIELGLLYGISKRVNRWKFSGAVGAGFYKFSENNNRGGGSLFSSPGSLSDYKTTSRSVIGFPLTGSIMFQPRRLGIGLQVNGNINKIKSYGSFGVTYIFRF